MYDNQSKVTKSIADAAMKVMMGESQQPEVLSEELKGDQHKIDMNKNKKIDSEDFKILRKQKNVKEEKDSCEDEAEEAVDKHENKMHGKKGEVSKHEKEMHKEEAELDEGTKMDVGSGRTRNVGSYGTKYDSERDDEKQTSSDKPKRKAYGARQNFVRSPRVNEGTTTDLGGGRTRNTGSYGTKYDSERDDEKQTSSSDKPKRKAYGARQNFVRSSRVNEGFTDLLDLYTQGGVGSLIESLYIEIEEEATNDEFKKELDKAQAKSEGREKANVSQALVIASKRVNEDVEELDENYRQLATKGIGAETKKGLKVGMGVDYYHPKDGNKHMGSIKNMTDTHYTVKDDKTGDHHKFKYYTPMKEELQEEIKTTHENPLVTVHRNSRLHTHAHLSTANNIFDTKVKHTDVHKGPVTVKSGDGNLKFAISMHHAKEVKESVEDINEESLTAGKKLISKHGDGVHTAKVYKDRDYNEYQAHFYKNGKHMGEGPVSYHDEKDDAQSTAENEVKRMNAKVNEDLDETYNSDVKRAFPASGVKMGASAPKGTSYMPKDKKKAMGEPANKMREEVELQEKKLTSAEENKREEYVKGMKKGLQGFKQRYGNSGKEVMYATATKMAKKDA